ncbi:alpha/beta fold hydrolase [Sphingomonas sp. PAMC 26605]|uniref:alpha/beta fold hydrolase n=1 Tax=Sphingomonas sp. PAMC 26605 TaxID=1112214 RepID=UPI00026CCB48|nr:alpha/beta hydrolase [Sphingomonas sp. PAMC 26605]
MVSPQLYRRTIPAAARITRWTAPDGWVLRRFDWPASGRPRGRMLFQGGRGDIFEKYLEAFAHWQAQGWSITSFDWRGQGGSGRLSPNAHVGHVDDFQHYIDDFRAFWAEWRGAGGAAPHVAIGHSMGGHLLLRALVEGAAEPDAAVLVAPMLGLHSPFGATLGERLAGLLSGVGDAARPAWRGNEKPATTETRQALLTHDQDRYEDEIFWQSSKPELLLGPPSWRWVAEAFRSTRRLRDDQRLKTLAVPLLFVVPEHDKLVAPKAAYAVAARLPDAEVARFGADAAHEILREVDAVRARAIGAIDAFLAARAPGQSG